MTEPDVRIHRFVLGPVQTNTYVIGDAGRGEAVVIDPAWDGPRLARAIEDLRLRVTAIWLTHAHFDHFGAAGALVDRFGAAVALHPDDMELWRAKGAAPLFGFAGFDAGPAPSIPLADGMRLRAAGVDVEVRHVPGHSPGHVIFHVPSLRSAFCGDVIFAGGIGRTDLPGGDDEQLQRSLRERVLTLPDETVLYPGHGESTTVRDERDGNPFLIGG
jgi:glyoxylase-like metal-dependent hydrolase (beta-lactamase superfamily II)